MACKLLIKCRKEEAPIGVISVVMQCAKGSLLNWTPYLLNFLLDDCKDGHDLGTNFHYAWLIIFTELAGWGEPKYSSFYKRLRKCCTTKYAALWHTSYPNKRKPNFIIFSMLFD